MQISFVKSGGFAGALTKVKGSIHLKDGQPQVVGDSGYQRDLTSGETQAINALADTSALSQAATEMATAQSKRPGMADVDHYLVTVKTADGKSQDLSFNTSGSSADLQNLPPAAANFLRWIQQESQKILQHKMTAK